jgi:hypothetical protein
MSTRLPTIPSFHNLGARGATGNSTSSSSLVHIDKHAHEKYAKKLTCAISIFTEEIEEVEIIVPKNSRGMVGLKEYLLYQKLATEPIDHKFGVPSHLITDKSVAKDADQTRHHFIQQQYVDTLSKIEAVEQQIVVGAALENFDINKFHQKYIFSELNVVDMACWINIHQEKSKKKSWHSFRYGPKYVFFVLLAKCPN